MSDYGTDTDVDDQQDQAVPPPTRAVFFDRDNTLILGSDYLGDPEGVKLAPGAPGALAAVRRLGFAVVTVSNQSGVARGKFTEDDVRRVNERMDELLVEQNENATIDRHLFCPHHPDADGDYGVECDCRKPKPGMIRAAAEAMGLDLSQCWLIGDAPRDVEAGHAAGCRTILLTLAGVEASPAASAESDVKPDFRATTLAGAVGIVARESSRAAEANPPPQLSEPEAKPEPQPTTPAAAASVSQRTPMAQATDEILADLRRRRETPAEDFSVFRLLAGVAQMLALAALVWGGVFADAAPAAGPLLAGVHLQLLTITLLLASK